MHAAIDVALGGKMAEELAYGDRHTTTGVSSVSLTVDIIFHPLNSKHPLTNNTSTGPRRRNQPSFQHGDTLWHVQGHWSHEPPRPL